jgi:hypothetical protein
LRDVQAIDARGVNLVRNGACTARTLEPRDDHPLAHLQPLAIFVRASVLGIVAFALAVGVAVVRCTGSASGVCHGGVRSDHRLLDDRISKACSTVRALPRCSSAGHRAFLFGGDGRRARSSADALQA